MNDPTFLDITTSGVPFPYPFLFPFLFPEWAEGQKSKV
jgi:hypothetical protein